MAMQLSGSINLNGSLTGSIFATNGLVSSSTQVQNYDVFALNSNLYTATGSLIGITNGLMAFTAALDSTYATDAQLLPILQTTASLNTFTGSIQSEVNLIEAYTASLKGAAIVSSSQQITNYYKFAETASANTFYGNQTFSSSLLAVNGDGISINRIGGQPYIFWKGNGSDLGSIYGKTGGGLLLYNVSTAVITVNSDNTTTFADNIVMANGKGIDFSATSNGSGTMTSELLNDYEEGTWSPTIRGSGTAGTYELATDYTTYTKIGRQVTISGAIRLGTSITGGGTGYLQITGLPFGKAANTAAMGSVLLNGVDFTGSYVTIAFTSVSASSILYLSETVDNSTPIDLPISAVAANDEIVFTITYFN